MKINMGILFVLAILLFLACFFLVDKVATNKEDIAVLKTTVKEQAEIIERAALTADYTLSLGERNRHKLNELMGELADN